MALIAKICRMIDDAPQAPALASLAKAVDLSPAYFHRLFKRITGLTPKDYASARRAERSRNGLKRSETVTEAS